MSNTDPLELDELLAAEFDYIAQTAIQANEDRARVSSFYLVAVGSLVATLFGTQLFESDFFSRDVNLMFSGLFVLLTALGFFTTMQLARLRAAWYDSALAMNQLKDFMVSQNETLAAAFRWTTATLPPKHKTSSVAYFQTVEVALISGLMSGMAANFFQQAFVTIGPVNWLVTILMGVLIIVFQLLVYKRILG